MKLRTKRYEEWVTIEYAGSVCEVLVAPLNPADRDKMLDSNTKHEWDQGQRFDRVDVISYTYDKIDKVIQDWKGPEDQDGNPLPCTRDNKIALYLYETDFIDLVLNKAVQVARRVTEQNKALEGN